MRIVDRREGHRLREGRLRRGHGGRHRPGQDRLRPGHRRRRPVGQADLGHAGPAQGRSRSRAATARCTTTCRCGPIWCLQEGTLGVDPKLQRTNDGKMPPVIHVDTDAPLHSDVDGSLITDKLWGIYYKPDFHFGGVQGGAMPFKVKTAPDEVKVDPYGPESPGFHRRRRLRPYVGVGAGLLPEALRRHHAEIQEGAVGRHRQLHPGQLPGLRPVPRERLRHRRLATTATR